MAGVSPCYAKAALMAVGACCSKSRKQSDLLFDGDVAKIINCGIPVVPKTINDAFVLKQWIQVWDEAQLKMMTVGSGGVQIIKKKVDGQFWSLSDWIFHMCGVIMTKVDWIQRTLQRNVLSSSEGEMDDNFKENDPQDLKRKMKVKKIDGNANPKKKTKLIDVPLKALCLQSKVGNSKDTAKSKDSPQKGEEKKKALKTRKQRDLPSSSSEEEDSDDDEVEILHQKKRYNTRSSITEKTDKETIYNKLFGTSRSEAAVKVVISGATQNHPVEVTSRQLRSTGKSLQDASSTVKLDESSEELGDSDSSDDSEVESDSEDSDSGETDEEEDEKPDPNLSLEEWRKLEMKKLLGIFKHSRKDEFGKLEAFGNELMNAISKKRPFEPAEDYIIKEDTSVLDEVVTRLWETKVATGEKKNGKRVHRVTCMTKDGEDTGCTYLANHRSNFVNHYNANHMPLFKQYKCGICSQLYRRWSHISTHIVRSHQVYSKKECDVCGVLFQVTCIAAHKRLGHARPSDGKVIVKEDSKITEGKFAESDLKVTKKYAIHQIFIVLWKHDSKRDEVTVQITSKSSIVAALKKVDNSNSRGSSAKRHCKSRKLLDMGYKPQYDEIIPLNLFVKGAKLSHRAKFRIRRILRACAVHKSDKYNAMFEPIMHIIINKINAIKHLLPRRHRKLFEKQRPS